MNANELVTKRLQIKAESKLEVEQQLHEWNALLQNALRAPADHRLVREILWAMADLEGYALRLEIKAGMLPPQQDPATFCEHPAFEP